jgi:hypothetical protein
MALLVDIASEMSVFEGPASKHIMFTMGDDFTYQVSRVTRLVKFLPIEILFALSSFFGNYKIKSQLQGSSFLQLWLSIHFCQKKENELGFVLGNFLTNSVSCTAGRLRFELPDLEKFNL